MALVLTGKKSRFRGQLARADLYTVGIGVFYSYMIWREHCARQRNFSVYLQRRYEKIKNQCSFSRRLIFLSWERYFTVSTMSELAEKQRQIRNEKLVRFVQTE